MTISKEFEDYLLDLLHPLGPVSVRRMFGGAGIFYDGVMFGLIADEEIYLKVDSENISGFEDAGSSPFLYMKKGKEVALKSYYSLPEGVIDETENLLDWARASVDVALRAEKKKNKKAEPRLKKSRR